MPRRECSASSVGYLDSELVAMNVLSSVELKSRVCDVCIVRAQPGLVAQAHSRQHSASFMKTGLFIAMSVRTHI